MIGFERKQTPSGKTSVRVTVGYKNNQQVKVAKTFPKGTAETHILKWVIEAKEVGVPEQLPPTAFDDLLSEWLAFKKPRLAANTFKTYSQSCEAYLRGQLKDIDKVSVLDLQRLVDSHAHLSYRSLELIKAYLRMIFGYAVLRGYLETSPVTKALSIPKRRQKRSIRVLSVEQFDTLSAALEGGGKLELALRTLLLSGLRVSELLALEPKHVSAKTLTVEQSLESRYGQRVPTPPKSEHAYRTLTIPSALGQSILSLAATPFVFPVGNSALREGLKRICKAQNLPNLTLHALRHSHCTYLLAQGVNVLAVSKRLGHHSPAFTLDRYGHLVPSMNDKLDEVLG